MKKVFAFLFVALMTVTVFAAPPTLATLDNMEWQIVATNDNNGTVDTMRLTGATSDTILVKETIEPGWTYVIKSSDSINAVTDSIQGSVIVYGTNRTTQMDLVHFGTDSTTSYNTHLLPIGATTMGSCFSIKYTRAAATTKTAIYRWELWKVRRNTINQNWNFRR
jgi:hypothetical protein